MPELPEVETVRKVLDESLKNLTITDISIRYSPIVINNEEFYNNVCGKKIIELKRLGKYLIFILDSGAFISHLRMEGKYFYLKKDTYDNKHIHVIFYLSNGYMLCYQDVRKFGRMEYKDIKDLYTTAPLVNVGVDPILSKEIEIDPIYDKIVNKVVPIKVSLLDQEIIAGLGNIYVDEVLFKAKINPNKKSSLITKDEVNRIIKYSKEILSKAIEYKGTTIKSYTSSLGVEGNYQQFLLVHTKEFCPICNAKLEKTKISGRSTYYCNNCQR